MARVARGLSRGPGARAAPGGSDRVAGPRPGRDSGRRRLARVQPCMARLFRRPGLAAVLSGDHGLHHPDPVRRCKAAGTCRPRCTRRAGSTLGDRDSTAHGRGSRRRDRRAGIPCRIQYRTGAAGLARGVRADGAGWLRRRRPPRRLLPGGNTRLGWALAQGELAVRPRRLDAVQHTHRLGARRGGGSPE